MKQWEKLKKNHHVLLSRLTETLRTFLLPFIEDKTRQDRRIKWKTLNEWVYFSASFARRREKKSGTIKSKLIVKMWWNKKRRKISKNFHILNWSRKVKQKKKRNNENKALIKPFFSVRVSFIELNVFNLLCCSSYNFLQPSQVILSFLYFITGRQWSFVPFVEAWKLHFSSSRMFDRKVRYKPFSGSFFQKQNVNPYHSKFCCI